MSLGGVQRSYISDSPGQDKCAKEQYNGQGSPKSAEGTADVNHSMCFTSLSVYSPSLQFIVAFMLVELSD